MLLRGRAAIAPGESASVPWGAVLGLVGGVRAVARGRGGPGTISPPAGERFGVERGR